jgi:hypothetical protein
MEALGVGYFLTSPFCGILSAHPAILLASCLFTKPREVGGGSKGEARKEDCGVSKVFAMKEVAHAQSLQDTRESREGPR